MYREEILVKDCIVLPFFLSKPENPPEINLAIRISLRARIFNIFLLIFTLNMAVLRLSHT